MTVKFKDPMDPTDVLDYIADFSNILEDTEMIQSGTLVSEVLPESASLGFEISNVTIKPDGQRIVFFAKVNSANQQDDVWSWNGRNVKVRFTFETNITPRKFQRTFVIRVKQL